MVSHFSASCDMLARIIHETPMDCDLADFRSVLVVKIGGDRRAGVFVGRDRGFNGTEKRFWTKARRNVPCGSILDRFSDSYFVPWKRITSPGAIALRAESPKCADRDSSSAAQAIFSASSPGASLPPSGVSL